MRKNENECELHEITEADFFEVPWLVQDVNPHELQMLNELLAEFESLTPLAIATNSFSKLETTTRQKADWLRHE